MGSGRQWQGDSRGERDSINRRDLLRYSALAGVGLVMAPVLSACNVGGSSPGGAPGGPPPSKPTGTLRVASQELISLDPTLDTGPGLQALTPNVYESLLRYKGDSIELENLLARSHRSSPDAKEWVFELKEGVRFHDGEPLTSSAVRASYEYYARAGTPWPGIAPQNVTYDDSDPKIFRIASSVPLPDMARNATFIRIISPKLLAAGPEAVGKAPAGTGPFRFGRYDTSNSLVIEAVDNYHAGGAPHLEKIQFQIIPDPSSQIAALRSGGIDLIRKVTPADAQPLRSDSSLVLVEKASWGQTQLLFFLNSPPVDNVKLRQAIACAIDRETIIRVLLGGAGKQHDSVLPPGVYGYAHPESTYTFDLDRAKRLLAESGLRTPVDMETVWDVGFTTSTSAERLSRAVAGMVEKIGINLKVTQKPISQFAKDFFDPKVVPSYQLATGDNSWVTGGPLFFNTSYFQNATRFNDPRFLELNDKMLTTPDGPERLKLLADIQNLFAEQLPQIPLFTKLDISAHKANLQGYISSPDGIQADFGKAYLG
ncbi:ABC transporter substrate-binding protein [Saccharomonospora sp. NPDC006951]